MAAKRALMTGWALLLIVLACCQRWAAARQLLQEQEVNWLWQWLLESGVHVGQVSISYEVPMTVHTSSFSRNNESLKTAKLTANYTIVSDPQKAEADLPILYFLLPWGMEAHHYSRLLAGLAAKGYTVVVGLAIEPLPSSTLEAAANGTQGCPQDQLVPSAATLSVFSHNMDLFEEHLGPKAGPNPVVVLIGSRHGALAALLAASGKCSDPGDLAGTNATVFCNGWRGFEGRIHGVITNDIIPGSQELGAFNLTGVQFSLFTVGDWDQDGASKLAYQATSSACNSYMQFNAMNSYSWADYMANSTIGQWPACTPKEEGTPDFFPTLNQQNRNIQLAELIVDAAIKAELVADYRYGEFLASIKDRPRVARALGNECFG